MNRQQFIDAWLARWGLAAMVVVAAVVGLVLGLTVRVPPDIPGVALQAEPVYRLEVGGSIFVGLYLAATAFALAVQNRAFVEFGSGGVKARSLRDLPEALVTHERTLSVLLSAIAEIGDPGVDRKGD